LIHFESGVVEVIHFKLSNWSKIEGLDIDTGDGEVEGEFGCFNQDEEFDFSGETHEIDGILGFAFGGN
jgi:hypothetical protein